MLVETSGNFGLIDPHNGADIAHDGPTEVVETPFIRDRIELGQLVVVEKPKAKTARPAAE